MASRPSLNSLAFALFLTGCGPPLGTYEFDNVRLESWETLRRVDPDLFSTPRTEHVLRVQFSSATNVETASGGGDLYVHADFCPLVQEFRIGAFGPYYGDRSPYSGFHTRTRELPDGRLVGIVEGEKLNPPRNPRTGRYIYTVYVLPYRTARTGTVTAQEAYDLRTETRDLCLRLDQPGYYLTNSQSRVFVVPGAAIAETFRTVPRTDG